VPADFGDYIEGCGRARQVKVPSFVDFKPLKRALEEPEFIMWDFANFEAPSQLHSLWQALYAFEEKHGRSPNVRSNEDAELLSKELPTSSPEIPKDWTQKFSFQVLFNITVVLINFLIIGCLGNRKSSTDYFTHWRHCGSRSDESSHSSHDPTTTIPLHSSFGCVAWRLLDIRYRQGHC
jgi:hypothetical protein